MIDTIWRARGEVALDQPLTADQAFARLDPLFQHPGTTFAVDGDTLTYSKTNPAAQDPLATFTRGTLQYQQRAIRYDVKSTALLLCFLAPLLFLGFAQLSLAANAWEKSGAEVEEKAKKEEDKPKPVRKLNPVDEFLGAPPPDDPDKKKDEKKEDEDDGPHSPTPAYVLAGLFFVIYLVGRVLEPWLFRRRLRAGLSANAIDAGSPAAATPIAET